LENAVIHDDSGRLIANWIKENKINLKYLTIKDSFMNPITHEEILNALKICKNVREIKIVNSDILRYGEIFFDKLVEAILYNGANKLEKLTISGHIFDEVIMYQKIARLGKIHSLKELDLSNNKLEGVFVVRLKEMIKDDINFQMETLDFSGNYIDDESLSNLGPIFKTYDKLKTLNLYNSDFLNDDSLRILIDAVKSSQSLTFVGLDEEWYDPNLINELHEILNKNK